MNENCETDLPGDGKTTEVELVRGPLSGAKAPVKGDKLPDEVVLYGLRYVHNPATGKFVYEEPPFNPGIEHIDGFLTSTEIQAALASAMLTKKGGFGTLVPEAIEIAFEKDITQTGFVMHSAFIRVKIKAGAAKNRG